MCPGPVPTGNVWRRTDFARNLEKKAHPAFWFCFATRASEVQYKWRLWPKRVSITFWTNRPYGKANHFVSTWQNNTFCRCFKSDLCKKRLSCMGSGRTTLWWLKRVTFSRICLAVYLLPISQMSTTQVIYTEAPCSIMARRYFTARRYIRDFSILSVKRPQYT